MITKVAVLHDFLDAVGGAEEVALGLARHFDADLITTNADPAVADALGFRDVRVVSLGQLPQGTPRRHMAARRAFARVRLTGYDRYVLSGNWAIFAARHHHPNVWICQTPTRFLYDQRGATLARLSGPSRWAFRVWSRMYRFLDQGSVGHCDRIVANSHNVEGRVRRYYGRDPEVVYPPVDTSRFRFERIGDFWLSVTRLYPEKRIELQLEAFRNLPEAKLTIVGGYAPGDRAEEYVRSLHPPPNVTFLGRIPREDLVDLYARCRGLVASAVDEDFGITPVEAMASGKCVVATDEGGYRETVVPGKTGFLLPAQPATLAERLGGLDDATLLAMREACVARAREFDASVFYERIERILAGRP